MLKPKRREWNGGKTGAQIGNRTVKIAAQIARIGATAASPVTPLAANQMTKMIRRRPSAAG
jgi:hypothetical protein